MSFMKSELDGLLYAPWHGVPANRLYGPGALLERGCGKDMIVLRYAVGGTPVRDCEPAHASSEFRAPLEILASGIFATSLQSVLSNEEEEEGGERETERRRHNFRKRE